MMAIVEETYLGRLRRELERAELIRDMTLSRDHRAEMRTQVKRLKAQIAAAEKHGPPTLVEARCDRCTALMIPARVSGADMLVCSDCERR
jgi:hypothetical protein